MIDYFKEFKIYTESILSNVKATSNHFYSKDNLKIVYKDCL